MKRTGYTIPEPAYCRKTNRAPSSLFTYQKCQFQISMNVPRPHVSTVGFVWMVSIGIRVFALEDGSAIDAKLVSIFLNLFKGIFSDVKAK